MFLIYMSGNESSKELMNEAYDAALVTIGVVGVSMASKKVLGQKLTDAENAKTIAKLAAGVTVSTMLVKHAKDKKWVPSDHLNKML